MKKHLFYLAGCFCLFSIVVSAQPNWHTTGNNATNPANNFLGTTDAVDLVVRTNNTERLRIKATTGGLRLANTANDYLLYGTKSGTGNGIYASVTNASSTSATIYGRNSGTGNGIYGYSAKGVGINGYTAGTNTYGVQGYSSHSGVYGTGISYGVTGYGTGTFGIGVWGNGVDYGVYGFSNDGTAINALTYAESNYALYVSGKNYRGLYCEGGTDWYTAYFNGDVYTTGVYQSSDARLKKNIKEVDNALDIINKLQPRNYEFRNDGSYALLNLPAGKHYGLLAQDVEKILPGLVKEEAYHTKDAGRKNPELLTDSDGLPTRAATAAKDTKSESINVKAVNYTELIPIMIRAMQELSKQNEEKDVKINDLQQQVNELKRSSAVISEDSKAGIITGTSLAQNIPNPARNSTMINYTLPQNYTSAKIIITDKSGVRVKEANLHDSGKGSLNIDASGLASGVYTYSLIVDNKIVGTKKMVLAK